MVWALGIGLALYGIHWREQPFLDYGLFLPQLGLLIIVFTLISYFLDHKQFPGLGPKIVWIPMLVIVVSMWLRLFVDFSLQTVTGGLYGIVLFLLYTTSRILGKDIFKAFIPFVVVVAISVIINGVMHPGEITGGIITNYCASAGFMIFGTIVNNFKWQWVLSTIALIALCFVGALEGVFIMAVLIVAILWRRDWGKRILLPLGIVVALIVSLGIIGYLVPLYNHNPNLNSLSQFIRSGVLDEETLNGVTTSRWVVAKKALSDIQILGHGYKPGLAEPFTVHNVPLVIVDQIGPLAGLAWLVVSLWCLIKTKWKYAWIAVIAMGVWDHYVWTQFAPYFWVLVGVSTTSKITSDRIFRE
jgi:hypothetical protein